MRAFRCNNVYITKFRSMKVPVSFRTRYAMADKRILVDSRATDNFIHPKFVKHLRVGMQELERPMKIWNIDGTTNQAGRLTHFVDLLVQTKGQEKKMRFLVTDLGVEDIILGYPWLSTFEPQFSWKDATVDTNILPVVIRSPDWHTLILRPSIRRAKVEQERSIVDTCIGRTVTEDVKQRIVDILTEEVAINSISTNLARQAEQYTTKVDVPKKYQQHARVFSEEAAQRFPPKRPWDHAIELKPGTPDVIDCKIYPLTQTEDQALVAFLDEQLKKGYIRLSKSPYTSPFFFIKKKDGKLRPVQDYRKLNEHTIRNCYPLPFIPDLISQVQDTHIFTKFDIRWGYNNIRIKVGDEEKGAFKTKYGLFEPLVMFFGLTNSPSTFQTMMNHIFRDLHVCHLQTGTRIIVYMDDILIATSSTLAAHERAVHNVLLHLEEHDLYLKPEKCGSETPSVDYLGVILEKGVTCMDPIKILSIADWPIPKTVKDVRSFLGFCNFYQAFIRGFANIARPLNQLTRKDVEWTWDSKEQQAFEDLRRRVTAEPVLKQPELDKPFELEVDASGFTVGAILLQRGEDNKHHPIGYYSATLIEAECNYDIYDLELLAIVKALRNWQPFLARSPHIITVFTDHANLQYWRQPHKISRQITREVTELAKYNVILRHIPGKANGCADVLSRHPDYDQGTRDNENVTVLPDTLFIRSLTIAEPNYDQKMSTIRKWNDAHRLKEFGGKWYKEGRLVITGDTTERRKIVREFHDPPTAGHPGIARTKDLIARAYWWPKLQKDVEEYVKGCTPCQANKINTHTHK